MSSKFILVYVALFVASSQSSSIPLLGWIVSDAIWGIVEYGPELSLPLRNFLYPKPPTFPQLSALPISTHCVDTPSWNNGDGNDCKDYEEYFCENGRAKMEDEFSGFVFTFGAKYKHPEYNCCACGKNKGCRDFDSKTNCMYIKNLGHCPEKDCQKTCGMCQPAPFCVRYYDNCNTKQWFDCKTDQLLGHGPFYDDCPKNNGRCIEDHNANKKYYCDPSMLNLSKNVTIQL